MAMVPNNAVRRLLGKVIAWERYRKALEQIEFSAAREIVKAQQARIRELEAERDRYREALERIELRMRGTASEAGRIAREALGEAKP